MFTGIQPAFQSRADDVCTISGFPAAIHQQKTVVTTYGFYLFPGVCQGKNGEKWILFSLPCPGCCGGGAEHDGGLHLCHAVKQKQLEPSANHMRLRGATENRSHAVTRQGKGEGPRVPQKARSPWAGEVQLPSALLGEALPVPPTGRQLHARQGSLSRRTASRWRAVGSLSWGKRR